MEYQVLPLINSFIKNHTLLGRERDSFREGKGEAPHVCDVPTYQGRTK